MLHALLAAKPELAIFAALTLGYAVGRIKIGQFSLGGVAGTLLAALAIGQLGVHIDPGVPSFMFTLFVYSLGFSVAPQFFSSFDRTTWTWALLVAVEAVLLLGIVFLATSLLKLDVGTASGLLAGAATESAVVGTTRDAIGRLAISPAMVQSLQANVVTTYGLTYVVGLITIVLVSSQLAPRLLGINLRKEARRVMSTLEGGDLNLDPEQSHSFPPLVSRSYRVTTAGGKTVAAIESELSDNATIEIIRRGADLVPVSKNTLLAAGDEVGVAGRRAALKDAGHVIGSELGDSNDVDFIVETRDVVFTRGASGKQTVTGILQLLRSSGCRGVYLAGIVRMERNLPPLPASVLRHGDVLQLFGRPDDVAKAARLLGQSEISDNATDLIYMGAGLLVGVLIGFVTVPLAGAALSLGSAGPLLAGLGFGWMRSRRPTFGAFPSAATQILKDLGLAVFIAAIGLNSAPSVLALIEARGWELPIVAVFLSGVPAIVSIYIGRYLLHMEPAILCGAIAGQHASTPAIEATEAVAGNPVPVIGYTVTYAVANIVLPLLGPILVAILGRVNHP